MDIEQLKLVLQTVQGVSNGALTVTIIFFLKSFVESLIGYGIGIYLIRKIAEILHSLISKTAFMSQIADATNGQCSTPFNSEEKDLILKYIRKGKNSPGAQ